MGAGVRVTRRERPAAQATAIAAIGRLWNNRFDKGAHSNTKTKRVKAMARPGPADHSCIDGS